MVEKKTSLITLKGGIKSAIPLTGLLQYGFLIQGETGVSIRRFLIETCGIDPHYIEKKITTFFLQGKPVDDIGSAIVAGDSTLSLSGSMPGLMGAMMRSGSRYSPLRSTITHSGSEPSGKQQNFVNIKLFNVILHDLGNFFLEKGINIDPIIFLDYLKNSRANIMKDFTEINFDGIPVSADELGDKITASGADLLFLKFIQEQ